MSRLASTPRPMTNGHTDTCLCPAQRASSVLSRVSIPSSIALLWKSEAKLTESGLRGSHIQCLYDLTFLYSAPGSADYRAPSLDEQLSCSDLTRAGYRYRIHVRRIPLDSLPTDGEGLKQWCEEAWGAKDDWLDKMVNQDEKVEM